jgi:hypothetical protein
MDEIDVRRRKARRTLAALALICAAPVVASYVAYYMLHPAQRTNYGELEAKPAPEIVGATADGAPWRLSSLRGRWVLLVLDADGCDRVCERALYATRQARTIQGGEQDRIARVLLQPAGAVPPSAAVRAQQPGLTVAQADPRQWTSLLSGEAQSILLVDPLGNLVLRYPPDPDIRRLARDLERVLKASRIG